MSRGSDVPSFSDITSRAGGKDTFTTLGDGSAFIADGFLRENNGNFRSGGSEKVGIKPLMAELYDMSRTGAVFSAKQFRLSILQYSKVMIYQSLVHPNTEALNEAIDEYWVSAFEKIDDNFTVYGACPFKEETFKYGEEKIQVPVPCDDLTWTYAREWDDKLCKYRIVVRDIFTQEEIKLVVFSSRCSGPRIDNSWIDSECGAILPHYRRYQKMLQLHDQIASSEMDRDVLIQRVTPATSHNIDEEQKRAIDMLNSIRRGMSGFSKKEELEFKRNGRYLRIPEMHQMATYQPKPTMHVDIQKETDLFHSHVSGCLRVPSTIFSGGMRNGSGGLGGRPNEKELDAERHNLSSAFEDISSDEKRAFVQLWKMFYGESINVVISVRAFTDRDSIEHMVQMGAIDSVHGNDLLLEIAGIRPEFSEYKRHVNHIQKLVDREVGLSSATTLTEEGEREEGGPLDGKGAKSKDKKKAKTKKKKSEEVDASFLGRRVKSVKSGWKQTEDQNDVQLLMGDIVRNSTKRRRLQI